MKKNNGIKRISRDHRSKIFTVYLLVPFVSLFASFVCVASYEVLLKTSSIWSRTFSVRSATSSAVRPLVDIFGNTVAVNLPVKRKSELQHKATNFVYTGSMCTDYKNPS